MSSKTPEFETQSVRDFEAEPIRTDGPNCVGFVLYKLGILKTERFIKPGVYKTYKTIFDEIDDSAQADCVGVRVSVPGATPELTHIALVDKTNPSYVLSRSRPGSEITRESIKELCLRYPQKIFDIIFLKIKQKIQ